MGRCPTNGRFRGVFGLDGKFVGDLTAPGFFATLSLAFPLTTVPGPVSGIVSNRAGNIAFILPRIPFRHTAPTTRVGRYTIVLPPPGPGATLPQGIGFGTLLIRENGLASIVGRTGDGTQFVSTTFVQPDGKLPFYAPLYRQPGSLSGTLDFTPAGAFVRLSGPLSWFKPAIPRALYFARGFRTTVNASGSSYVEPLVSVDPAVRTRPIDLRNATPNATFTLASGDFLRPVNQPATLNRRPAAGPYAIAIQPTGRVPARATIQARTGLFTGVFKSNGRPARSFTGVFIQADNFGAGVFSGARRAGSVRLTPLPAPVR